MKNRIRATALSSTMLSSVALGMESPWLRTEAPAQSPARITHSSPYIFYYD